MIVRASRNNTAEIVHLLQQFLQHTAYKQAPDAAKNYRHLCQMTWAVLEHGAIWIAHKDSKPVGLLMAVQQPNMWAPNIRELRELVFYVAPEHRGGTLAGRLFKTFEQYAEAAKAAGEIDVYFTTRMSTTANYDLEHRGFRLMETTYIKE